MVKKRKDEQKPRTFRNEPFHSLKGVRVNAASRTDRIPATTAPDDQADDPGLFARAVRGARPIGGSDDEAGEAASLPAPQGKTPAEENDDGLFLAAMTALGAASVPERRADVEEPDEEEPRRSSSRRLRQLKKGSIRISQELDLHGSLRDDAIRKLQQFIAGAFARGDQAVLVITGKGINSADGPVLPGAVSAWLQGPGKGMVAEFLPAPRDRGGSGALVVFLRQRK